MSRALAHLPWDQNGGCASATLQVWMHLQPLCIRTMKGPRASWCLKDRRPEICLVRCFNYYIYYIWGTMLTSFSLKRSVNRNGMSFMKTFVMDARVAAPRICIAKSTSSVGILQLKLFMFSFYWSMNLVAVQVKVKWQILFSRLLVGNVILCTIISVDPLSKTCALTQAEVVRKSWHYIYFSY